jgi:flavin-binding protein dodecin
MVYKYIDIVGVSSEGITEAVNEAVVEAARSVKSLRWAEVGRVTLRIEDQKIREYQAEVKIGFEVQRGES